MNVETTVHVWEEDGQFVAHAMPLDVMSCGPTVEAARQAVDEAVRAFLATAKEMGTLDEMFSNPQRAAQQRHEAAELDEVGTDGSGERW